jgi:hypothetical protein
MMDKQLGFQPFIVYNNYQHMHRQNLILQQGNSRLMSFSQQVTPTLNNNWLIVIEGWLIFYHYLYGITLNYYWIWNFLIA